MFIHKETGEPAWLLEQDPESDVIYTDHFPSRRTRDSIWSMPAHQFFAEHREATAAEIRQHTPAPPAAVRETMRTPMQQPSHEAKPAQTARKSSGRQASASGKRTAKKAATTSAKKDPATAPAEQSPPAPPQTPPGGEGQQKA